MKRAIPLPPAGVTGEARKEWGRVTRDLYDLGIIGTIDRAILAAYCESYSTWREAMKRLGFSKARGGGLVVMSKNGSLMQNPMLAVANRAKADMVRFAIELGMTPAARSRVKVDELPKFDTPANDDSGEGEAPAEEFFED